VVGRADDMIVPGGENVFPRPVEDAITAMPEVACRALP
jgi:acyl-CoA synthetase (AMP-forming)/AMP-acid ligase II